MNCFNSPWATWWRRRRRWWWWWTSTQLAPVSHPGHYLAAAAVYSVFAQSVFVNRYESVQSHFCCKARTSLQQSWRRCLSPSLCFFPRCDRRGDRLRDRSRRRSLRRLHRARTFCLNWNILRARSEFRFSSPVRLRFHLIDGRPRWMRSY